MMRGIRMGESETGSILEEGRQFPGSTLFESS